jgi:hypothetical protein
MEPALLDMKFRQVHADCAHTPAKAPARSNPAGIFRMKTRTQNPLRIRCVPNIFSEKATDGTYHNTRPPVGGIPEIPEIKTMLPCPFFSTHRYPDPDLRLRTDISKARPRRSEDLSVRYQLIAKG